MNLKLYQVFKIFDTNLKKKVAVILFLCLIIVPLEFLSIAAIIPLFAGIFETSSTLNIEFLNLQIFDQNKVNSSLIILVSIFFLKSLLLALIFKLKFKYVYSINRKLSHMIFFNNITSDYNFYIKNDTSTVIRNIMTEVGFFTSGYILSLIDLTLEILILLTVGIFLVIYNPKVTAILFIFFIVVTFFIDQMKKKKVEEAGLLRHQYNKYVLQLISGAFRGIKEIKANFLENKMFNLFRERNNKALLFSEKISYYRSLPKIIFELLCIIALSTIVFINKDINTNIGEMIAVYAFATFRILPSFVRLTLILQDLKIALPSINVIENEYLNKKEEIQNRIKKNNEMLEIIKNNPKKKYDEVRILINEFKYEEERVLKDIDLSIKIGDKICITGESGSGKSTLVDIITGIIEHKDIQIFSHGDKVSDKVFFQKSAFSYIPQNPTVFQNSIKENIVLFEENIDEDKYSRAVKLSKLDFVDELKEKDNTILSESGDNLSGGQLQRIFVARAIYSDKSILIFDESTNELDSETEQEIIDDILKLPQAVLFITHKEELKKKFSKIIHLKNKQIL